MRYEFKVEHVSFGAIEFINYLVFPLFICWSLPQYHWYELIYWQVSFTAIIVILCSWRMVRNKKRVDVLLIDTKEQRTLFAVQSEQSRDKNSDAYKIFIENTHNANNAENANKAENVNIAYTIETSSRFTQFCIFLRLAVEPDNLKKNKQIYSTVLFKWQLSESHFRKLSALINANSD